MRKIKNPITSDEKKVIKNLLNKGWRNQDILNLINTNRKSPINSGRISEIKKDNEQEVASDNEVECFRFKKESYDPKTGLNYYEDEQLVRVREAMILAVQLFNSTALKFKTQAFTIFSVIAWTYLIHEYSIREFGPNSILRKDNNYTKSLAEILKGFKALPEAVITNLNDIIQIRDAVEHSKVGPSEGRWYSIFQACCLNFDKYLCNWFDKKLTLGNELSFALQFVKPAIEDCTQLMEYDIPPKIKAIDQALQKHDKEILENAEYQFQVVYLLNKSTKGKVHYKFINDEQQIEEIRNILIKDRFLDKSDLYPYKPKGVVKKVREGTNNSNFNIYFHTEAWKYFKIRPSEGNRSSEKTEEKYCHYFTLDKQYSYSEEWIDFLIDQIKNHSLLKKLQK